MVSEEERRKIIDETTSRIVDDIQKDVELIPAEYRRLRVYAVFHRINNFILNGYEQTEEVSEYEAGEMRRLRAAGFSIHDIGFAVRRSSSTVHEHLKGVLFSERVDQLIEETKQKAKN